MDLQEERSFQSSDDIWDDDCPALHDGDPEFVRRLFGPIALMLAGPAADAAG